MKRLYLLGGLLLLPFCAMAQSSVPLSTTDHFVVMPTVMQPGGDGVWMTVGVEGGEDNRLYTAYNMDLFLPEGMSVAENSSGGPRAGLVLTGEGMMYPLDEDTNLPTHAFFSKVWEDGHLRLASFSSINADFLYVSGPLFRVMVNTSPWAKPGQREVRMTGLNLTIRENAQKYIPEGDLNTGTVTVGTSATVPVAVSASNKYGTCIMPFAVAQLPEGLEAYTVGSIAGGTLTLERAEQIEAYRPYILYAEHGYSGSFNGEVNAALYPDEAKAVTENGLTGVLVPTEVAGGYIMQNQGDGVQFYAVGDVPFALPAGKCYLSAQSVAGQSALRMVRTATGITEMVSDAATVSAPLYDMLGRKVATPLPGHIYISGKRKVIVK